MLILFVIAGLLLTAACSTPIPYDLILRNGTIYDGSGETRLTSVTSPSKGMSSRRSETSRTPKAGGKSTSKGWRSHRASSI